MKAEQGVERYLCRRVKERRGMCIKLTGYNGIPDRLVVTKDGRCLFCELKVEGGIVAPIQSAIHYKLRLMHQSVYVLWDYKQVDEFIEKENI